jgi:hypothetical protein
MFRIVLFLIVLFHLSSSLFAQNPNEHSSHATAEAASKQTMPDMPGMTHDAAQALEPLAGVILAHTTSGTGAEPGSTPAPMLMRVEGRWHLMLHGEAFLNELQQSGPRGADKFFSTNWLMGMAQRKAGNGMLIFRAMLSLEPATVTKRQYPLLFQQGETAFGQPIADGQHPHDFFMELAALYDYKIGEHSLLSFYGAPMGDPAMGPVAYPHRASASENPLASLGHHLEDSTHIAADVVTAGFTYRNLRIEASGFHGREPDESRWNINSGAIDSWSTRVTVSPGKNWSAQYSIAGLHSPESLAPGEDVRRMTVSVSYNRPISDGNWASTLLWGRNQNGDGSNVGNGYLLESTLRFRKRNFAWTRIENVDRTTELLLANTSGSPGFEERYFARVRASTLGYDREIGHVPHLATAVGGQFTWYGVPDIVRSDYGDRPMGVMVFLRVRIK